MQRRGYAIQLTERELQVLNLMSQGLCNKDIAHRLSVSIRTVKFHAGNIYARLGVRSRSEAIAWAWKRRLPQLTPGD